MKSKKSEAGESKAKGAGAAARSGKADSRSDDSPLRPAHELDDPALYVNRELSLLEFQRRVLEEAQDPNNPLLERVKFLAIVGSNLDEFFMVRVAGLQKQYDAGVVKLPPDAASAEAVP